MATIQDIADMTGYSIGTVSRVINNRADVSDKARDKIEHAIRELGYQPNSNARMLRQTVSSDITIIVRGIRSVFFQSLLEMIQIRLSEHGEHAHVRFIRETEDEVATAVQIVQHDKPKGLIFLGGSANTFRKEFSKISVPSVLISGNAENLGFANLSSFATDDYGGGAYAARVLLSHGHRRIGILGGYEGDVEGSQSDDGPALRIRGALEELAKSGLAFDAVRDYQVCPSSAEGGYQAAKQLLLRAPDLTAIFAISDAIAFGAIRAFKDMGFDVPKDISVVGFDGIAYTKYSVPRLSTIKQDVAQLAKRGVDDLLLRISYECPAVHEKIPYLFVNGESVAQPREEEQEAGRWQP